MTADAYLRDVSFWLGDLPLAQRQDLLAEIRTQLAELPPGTDLEARLGSPEVYAADLRAAAGLERRHRARAFLQARRPRNVVLAALALAAIGLAIGGVVWVQSYQPLRPGSTGLRPSGATQTAGGNSQSVAFRRGRPFQAGVTVKNTGPFTIHVDNAEEGELPVVARVLISPPLPADRLVGPFTPFRPFDLRPGQVRLILLEGVYGNCKAWAPGSIAGLDSIPVRFSYLWKSETVDVPLARRVAIVIPKRGCR